VSVQPSPWHIAVQPSEVDPHEEERPSGLVVHHAQDHADHCAYKIKRGVIVEMGHHVAADDNITLEVGDVIFYHEGVTLQGLEYVYPYGYTNIIAIEKRDA